MTIFPGIQGQGIQGESSIFIRIASLVTVVFMLAMSGIVGRNTGKISRQYSIKVTPPGGFFAIWGVIYLGLIISGVYCLVANTWSLAVTVLFSIVSILNGLWICIFNLASVKANIICFVVLLSMAILNELQWVWMQLPSNASPSLSNWNIANRNIISFYQGWLVAAANLNFGVMLVHSFGVSKRMQAYIFWIMCPLCIIGMVLLNLSRPEGFVNNIAMYFSAVYALTGAFISTRKNFSSQEQKPLIDPNGMKQK